MESNSVRVPVDADGVTDVSTTEWLLLFDQNYPLFKWFIYAYFGKEYVNELVEMRVNRENKRLYSRLNEVWFRLPDNRFNIIENPRGWREFLQVIEV